MSNPWFSPYDYWWWRQRVIYQTRPTSTEAEVSRLSDPSPSPWLSAEPDPCPWRSAAAYLVSLVAAKQVGQRLPEGQVKREVIMGTENAIARFIDEYCGNGQPPVPPRGPLMVDLVAELSLAADAIRNEGMREDILQIAVVITEKSFALSMNIETKLPTSEEIEAMAVFSATDHECQALCWDLQETADALQNAIGHRRLQLQARLKAINNQMRALNCRHCRPE